MTRRSVAAAGSLTVRAIALLVGLTAILLVPPVHAAVTCTASGPTMTFGTVDPYSGYPYSTSGNVNYTCTNTGSTAVTLYACVGVGTGSGGTSPTNRTLASGSATLPIQITGGSGYPYPVGNGTSYPLEGPLPLSVAANSSTSGTYAVAASLTAPASPPPPGTFTSNFTGTDAQDIFVVSSTAQSSCGSISAASHSTLQANFSINATVPTECTVTATSLAFPTASVLNATVTATATVSSTCNTSTPVTIALDNGATGSGPTTRQMRSGANAIGYGIYRDAGGTLPWGSTSGSNTASLSSGTGTLVAYGRVPAQTSPPPGTYTDVVNVTITY